MEKSEYWDEGTNMKNLEVRRRGMIFDPRGRLLRYDETQTVTDSTGKEKSKRIIERRNNTYDDQNHLTDYQETALDLDGFLKQKRWPAISPTTP